MTRVDIARRTKVLRRAATRPRRPRVEVFEIDDDGATATLVVQPDALAMTWKAARARVLEIHAPDRKPGRRAPSRKPRPCQGGKLRPAPGQWWQARFADLVERRAEGTPKLTKAQRHVLDVETHRVMVDPRDPGALTEVVRAEGAPTPGA